MAMRVRVAIVVLVIFGGLLGGRCHRTAEEWRSWEAVGGAGKQYLVGVKTSLEKVFRDPRKLKSDVTDMAVIKAARNEYESFQILLGSKNGDLGNIQIEPTELISRDREEVIQRENISLSLVGYVETKKPAYHVEYIGWWPDPLLPLEKFDLEAGGVQPIWVTIYVPADAAAGEYHGTILILPENAEAETVKVALTVWDFTLPRKPNLQVVFSLYEYCIRDYYKFDSVPQELLRQYYSFLLARRINPTSLYIHLGPQPQFEDMQFCVDRGLNAVNIAYLYDRRHNRGKRGYFSEEFKRSLKEALPQTLAFLRDHQWQDMAFVYGPDEPVQGDYAGVKEIFALVEQTAPGIRRVLTEGPTKELFGYVDVWVPRIDNYKERKCRRRQEIGEEIWWYVTASIHHPYPNFFVDYPAIDHRILFWLAWKYDISGFLYYSLNRWYTNYAQDHERWPDVPWNTRTYGKHNGDGQLMYPGPAGEPYSSVRLEVIRDGIEDFEYLQMLENELSELRDSTVENKEILLRRAEDLVSSVDEEVVCNSTSYTRNSSQLLLYREMVAEEIVEIGEILRQSSELWDAE